MKSFIRKLTPPESALTYCNAQAPMCTVIAIHLKGVLTEKMVCDALEKLQERHSLLRAGIVSSKSGYVFEALDPIPPVPLESVPRSSGRQWHTEVERALNTTFDDRGPLLRAVFISPVQGEMLSELLLVLHHSIIDGVSARLLLLDFLRLLGGQHLRNIPANSQVHEYPKAFLGVWAKVRFMARQMREEVTYLLRGGRHEIPPHSQNGVVSIRFDEAATSGIIASAGKAGLTLNSLIGAAMLHALVEQAPQKSSFLRAIAFADLRSRMLPPVSSHELGCYFSMARFSVRITPNTPIMETARQLWENMYAAGKSGDVFLFSMMSEQVLRMAWRFQRLRMADTALSYLGTLEAAPRYGDLEVRDVGAYITNNRFGPRITAFGMCLLGRLGIDMNYLTSEFDAKTAQAIVASIQKQLLSVGGVA